MATFKNAKKFKLNLLEEGLLNFANFMQPEDLLSDLERFVRYRGNLLRRDSSGNNYFHLMCDGLSSFNNSISEEQSSVISRVMDVFSQSGLPLDSPNHSGNTPLLVAVLHRCVPMVQMLLEKEADINNRNNSGRGVWEMIAQPSPFPHEMIFSKEIEKILLQYTQKNAEIFSAHLKQIAVVEKGIKKEIKEEGIKKEIKEEGIKKEIKEEEIKKDKI